MQGEKSAETGGGALAAGELQEYRAAVTKDRTDRRQYSGQVREQISGHELRLSGLKMEGDSYRQVAFGDIDDEDY